MNRILKSLIYVVIGSFAVYTLYLLLMMYVLNIISPRSSHTVHSANVSESKQNGFFVASYQFEKFLTGKNFADTLIPKEIFMERERIHYEYYYFYWGKTLDGNTISVDASGFNKLSRTGKYFYCSSSSMEGCNNGSLPLDEYNKNLYFAVATAPDSFLISIYKPGDFSNPVTIVYKKK
jgi:hypothetical protein